MSLILTYEQQQAIKPIGGLNGANQVAIAKYNVLAQEVQDLEVYKLLGTAFAQSVETNPDGYQSLLDGADFYNCYGELVRHKGLRYVIAYLNYAQWILEGKVKDTYTGMKKQTTPDGEFLSSGEQKNLRDNYREIAFNAWGLIREYLDVKQSQYQLWTCRSDKKTRRTKITTLRATAKGGYVAPVKYDKSIFTINGIDYELNDEDMRTGTGIACNGTSGQFIAFTSTFVPVYALQVQSIGDTDLGITVDSYNENGFYISSLQAGTFNYIALKEK